MIYRAAEILVHFLRAGDTERCFCWFSSFEPL